jgi:hypothetical protein
MHLIAFITEGAQFSKTIDHIAVVCEPPHIAPARGPQLWEDCGDAQMDDGVHIEPDSGLTAQLAVMNRCGMTLRPVHAARHKSLP